LGLLADLDQLDDVPIYPEGISIGYESFNTFFDSFFIQHVLNTFLWKLKEEEVGSTRHRQGQLERIYKTVARYSSRRR
jgi:hypothetical protein